MATPSDPATYDQRRQIAVALRTLMRLAPAVHAHLARQAGIGPTDLSALDNLLRSDTPMGVVELGNSLGIRSASATVLVDRLTAAGHLRRAPHPSDGRRRVVHVTDHARTDLRKVLEPLTDPIAAVTGRLDATSGQIVLQFLTDVCAVLDDFVDPQPGSDHAPHDPTEGHDA